MASLSPLPLSSCSASFGDQDDVRAGGRGAVGCGDQEVAAGPGRVEDVAALAVGVGHVRLIAGGIYQRHRGVGQRSAVAAAQVPVDKVVAGGQGQSVAQRRAQSPEGIAGFRGRPASGQATWPGRVPCPAASARVFMAGTAWA